MNLIKEATDIIHSEYPTRRDMVQLSRIEFDMSVEAMEASRLASEKEEEYNLKRSEVVLEERWRKRSITEATEIWKYVAEKECWCYRTMKQKAKDMWNVIDSIRWFKIAVYSSEKESDDAMNKNYNF